jgi:hypothetical protein
MSVLTGLRRARTTLVIAVAAAAVFWAAGVSLAALLVFALLDMAFALPVEVRRAVVPAVLFLGVAAAAVVVWFGRNARSLARVALFLEERLPSLNYTLAAVVQPSGGPSAEVLAVLERSAARVDIRPTIRRTALRATLVPFGVALGLTLAATLMPSGTMERLVSPRVGDVLLRPGTGTAALLGSRLSPIAVHVTEPAYAGRERPAVENPASIAALVGSTVDIRGRGAAAGLLDSMGAMLGMDSTGTRMKVSAVGDTWNLPVRMPAEPMVVRLFDRSHDRLLVLEPVPDEPPTVLLSKPSGDTLYLEPKGRIDLDAELNDDIGLARAEFEMMYTSGGGERFETTVTTFMRTRLNGRRAGRLQGAILLDTMKLHPGDVLHIRAIAWDANDVTGPGRGESETRTIRINDPRQPLDVKITAARAAAIDTTILSQRMLIMRAETLLVKRPQLEPEDYISQSLRLGVQQGALRGRVESIIFELENVEGVGFVGNTPSSLVLREAAEEMRTAERELSIVQVPVALVHMRNALRLLERIRDANRYWIRGLLTTDPVDVDRIRLTGRDPVNVRDRVARQQAEDARKSLLLRLDRAVELAEADGAAASDSLQLIYAAALTQARDIAEPLGSAIQSLLRGEDATDALVATRRRLERGVGSRPGLVPWTVSQ